MKPRAIRLHSLYAILFAEKCIGQPCTHFQATRETNIRQELSKCAKKGKHAAVPHIANIY